MDTFVRATYVRVYESILSCISNRRSEIYLHRSNVFNIKRIQTLLQIFLGVSALDPMFSIINYGGLMFSERNSYSFQI